MKYRSQKFKEENLSQIFSADVVTGARAKEIGLVDELGLPEEVMMAEHGEKVKIIDYSKTSRWEALGAQFSTYWQGEVRKVIA